MKGKINETSSVSVIDNIENNRYSISEVDMNITQIIYTGYNCC
jgi:hypothetical protein